MGAIPKLVRNAPREGLQEFLDAQECTLRERLRSFGPGDDYAGPLLQAVDELSDEEHARLTDNVDRVIQMVTEVGQSALLSVVQDRLLAEELENAYARSLWVFLNEHNSFRRAEEVCHTDGHRYGARMWSGYEGPKGLVPDGSAATVSAFEQAARKLFGSQKAHCEIYRRTRPNLDQPDSELYQLTLFHDDLPDTYLEFELEKERPVRRHRRPVIEVSITYEPVTGVIEVVASVGKLRDQLARIFAANVLRQEIAAEQIALRRFDVSRLLQPFDFPFDPADGIESVKLVLIRLHQMNNPKRRLTLECPRRADGTIWDQARDVLTQGDDLARAGYVATKATLSVKFLPGVGSRRGETLTFNITVPNGCDLKSQTERQRLVGERYVKSWGLLVEV
jgi:hypothetical protein